LHKGGGGSVGAGRTLRKGGDVLGEERGRKRCVTRKL